MTAYLHHSNFQEFKNKSYAHYFDENCTAIWNGMMQEGF